MQQLQLYSHSIMLSNDVQISGLAVVLTFPILAAFYDTSHGSPPSSMYSFVRNTDTKALFKLVVLSPPNTVHRCKNYEN